MKFKCAYDKIVDIDKLIPNPHNPNKHPQNQIDMLAKIIDFQGQRSPIIVSNRSGFITKGHGRLLALLRLGWKEVAVDFQDYQNEAEEYADMVADNKIAELAIHDDIAMINRLKEINFDLDFDLLGIQDFNLSQSSKEKLEFEPVNSEDQFLIIVNCKKESDQATLYQELLDRGLDCKVL